jgi:tetratricopeptide (TPR) repeat protein
MVAGCLFLALQLILAQNAPRKPAANTPETTRAVLVQKGHALEARGRPDMAIQLWQQILLSDPNNAEALAGLAKDLKLVGNSDQANATLDRLRKVNPSDPNIARIQSLSSTRAQSDQLRAAGDLARQGKVDQAMRIYRALYGDHPPDGDIALAYYQTLYGTASGKEQAIVGMRGLVERNPGDTRFDIELGRMLTYDTRTRAEGMRILRRYPADSYAQATLRQALLWDAANPASAEQLREYLKQHPQDTEISTDLKQDEAKLAQMNSGIARTPIEREAFAALNAKKLEEAQSLFYQILQKDPNNGRAAAGLGFLRMQQKNFGGAISYLTEAEQNGFKDKTVENALETSRFWFTMGEASDAVASNHFDEAESRYRSALAMHARSPEAISGLAGLLIQENKFAAAADAYQELVAIQPTNADAWRGLFLAYARDNQDDKAIAVSTHLPSPVSETLGKDPEYLRTLAVIYHRDHRNDDAQRVLAQALSLPFPADGAKLKLETRLEYAAILMEASRYDQAAEMYLTILNEDSSDLSAWMGLVSAQHQLKRDSEAIAEVEKMPPSVYDSALSDPGFLSMLGAIYQQANQPEIAQGLLERAAKLQLASGHQPGADLQLQLAALDLARNNPAQAYQLYHQVLVAHPDRIDAWKGLLATLQSTNHTAAALQQIALIPPKVRKQLESDVEFVQTEASIYAANNDYARAGQYMARLDSHYASLRTAPPPTIAIQNAWLLFNTRNDRALYPALMALGGRPDLTAAQRETVQDIWAQWSVRRADAAIEDGNGQRGKDLLDAAFQAFPDNVTVRKAVAGGYLTAGQAKEALAIFKTVPLQSATPADFQGAVGAALAAGDLNQAETWLRLALERYSVDPTVLALAARYETARGNNPRAAEYWRASLAALPPVSPTEKLAHELAYPDQARDGRKAHTPAELQELLNPENEPFSRTIKLPPLPSYGLDPYTASAPALLPQQPQAAPENYRTDPTAVVPAEPIALPATSPVSELNDLPAALPVPSPSPTLSASVMVPQALPEPQAQPEPRLSPAPQREPAYIPPSEFTRAAPEFASQDGPSKSELEKMGISPGEIAAQSMRGTLIAALPSADPTPAPTAQSAQSFESASSSAIEPASPVRFEYPSPVRIETAPSTIEPASTAGIEPAPRVNAEPVSTPPLESAASSLIEHAPSRTEPASAAIDEAAAQQTANELTEGAQTLIRALPNASVGNPTLAAAPSYDPSASPYLLAQYTPSAQEAASGAYSAPKQQAQPATHTLPQPSVQPQPEPAPVPAPEPAPAPDSTRTLHHRRHFAAPAQNPSSAQAPTLLTAPGTGQANPAPSGQVALQPNAPEAQPYGPLAGNPSYLYTPGAGAADTIAMAGITDQELQDRNLPPLRSSWVRVERQKQAVTPQDEAENQLQSIESGYSPWVGGTGALNYRSGDLGYDHLSALESPFESSTPLGYDARLTVVARPVFLDSGQADGSAVLSVEESTTSGNLLAPIPEPLGTDIHTGTPTTSTTTTTPTLSIPAQQNAAGVGGEVQLVFPHLALAGGYTPAEFLVSNATARANWRPAGGPWTFSFVRDSIKDSQLSYAGLRDPGGSGLGRAGQVWGGVVANQGNVQFSRGDAASGYYLGAGGQYINGTNVLSNSRFDFSGGSYWRIVTNPDFGNLSVGANFFAMHYANNQLAYTFGMGGYFSPQSYFLANVPFTWNGHAGTRWHYNLLGSFGVQAFQEDSAPLWPFAADHYLETETSNAALPDKTSVGPNYDIRAQGAYAISPNWYAGGFLGANNARNYTSATVGFYIRYMFRPQSSEASTSTGIFPTDGFRPFRVP